MENEIVEANDHDANIEFDKLHSIHYMVAFRFHGCGFLCYGVSNWKYFFWV